MLYSRLEKFMPFLPPAFMGLSCVNDYVEPMATFFAWVKFFFFFFFFFFCNTKGSWAGRNFYPAIIFGCMVLLYQEVIL